VGVEWGDPRANITLNEADDKRKRDDYGGVGRIFLFLLSLSGVAVMNVGGVF